MDATKVSFYFEAGHWNKAMVKNAVKKGVITTVQYEEITGEAYDGDIPAAEALNEIKEVLA
jgi:hypothetical protein